MPNIRTCLGARDRAVLSAVRPPALLAVLLVVLAAALPAPGQTFEPETLELTGTVRDFLSSHPDMQYRIGTDFGMVEPVLGEDGKPVYTKSRTSTSTTHGREFFDQWYRDVEGVNLSAPLTIPLTNSAGAPAIYTYDSSSFFPIDGQLFGNQGMGHNYYFTFELHSRFTYRGGEVFQFRGDDDVFVFINDRLVIDIGGVHTPIARSVSLDQVASNIGLEVGGTYDFALFFAERYCCGSNFRIQTSIVLEQPPEEPCGDGLLELGEQCDDGNLEDGDGCSSTCQLEGLPPVALCRDATLFPAAGSCSADATVDGGSHDPEGGTLGLVATPASPYGPGTTGVGLEVTDPDGSDATCAAEVEVVDRELPSLSCGAPAATRGGGPLAFTSTAGDNCQPPAAVDVTISAASCVDLDVDGDDVPDEDDACPDSDLSAVLAIGDCDTGVANDLAADGCTLSDEVADCAQGAANHGEFVSCVAHLTNGWRDEGRISGREKGAIQNCAARSPIPTAAPARPAAASLGQACPVVVDGTEVIVADAPSIGRVSWTLTATDEAGNSISEACAVELQTPDGPVPNLEPVADAGEGRSVSRGTVVALDGSGSVDLDGDPLTYRWVLTSPAGSAATLSDPASPAPTFVTDLAGAYEASLEVSDGTATSAPDAVRVHALNGAPSADAGADRTAFVGTAVAFDGTGSADPDGDALSYAWTLVRQPDGSTAALDDAVAPTVSLVPDLRGTYVARLTVSDGTFYAPSDSVVLTVPNAAPSADAGADREVSVFDTVVLDASASSDPEGDILAFAWAFVSRPAGSEAELDGNRTAMPSFVPDVAGSYEVELTAWDGLAAATDRVTVVTVNTPPVADAGADRTAFLGDVVTLDGGASSDVDGDALTYAWSFVLRPVGSDATLSDPSSEMPSFTADVRGVYEVELVVDDGQRPSAPDRVLVDVVNRAPVAEAGPDQVAFRGDLVQLDGSASFDLDGDLLDYAWSLVSAPAGSAATLSDPAAVSPTLSPDLEGDYVVELAVSDGDLASQPDRVTVSTVNARPVADAGADRTAFVGDSVVFDGTASSDPDGDPLTYAWSLVSAPAGSSAALSGAATPTPTLVLDLPGDYVIELVVSDGDLDSEPDRVSVSTENSRPVADAGADRSVETGTLVTLDGTASADADGDPLTYTWALTSVPDGSLAVLSDVAAPAPTFVADLEGSYVAQLIVSDGALDSEPDTVRIDAADALVEVPSFTGLTRSDAEAAIVAAGFVVGTVSEASSDTVPAGLVLSQNPAGGAEAAPGSAVDLVISSGPADDGSAPLASLLTPEADTEIAGTVDVLGTVSDPTLTGYDLSWSLVGDDAWTLFAQGTDPVVNGLLGRLDTSLIPNGLVELRLRAFDPLTVTTVTRVVRLDSQRKVGNFTISFNDVVLPVAGIPITVTRTYDSRRRTPGDFGVGWTLGLAQGSYANNRTPGEGWRIEASGGFISLPCQRVEETAGHLTEVRLSEAEAYLFQLDLVAPAAILGGCQATARFTPLAGNLTSSLEIVGNTEVYYPNGGDEVFDALTLEPFEPGDVRLTTADGRVVELNLETGITSIADGNGNRIDVSAAGVTHSGGSGITFSRDGSGRITTITRPDGGSLAYTYDSAGDLVAVTDASGAATTFEYDSDHFLTGIDDARGVPLVRNEYDADGRLVATVDADGKRTEITHDLAGNREIFRDRLGYLETFVYDADGNVVSHTDQLGETTTSTYDADGNVTSVTDPLGHTTTRSYDGDGNLLSETDATGATRSTTYHALGMPLTETDGNGETTTHTYDADGNRLSSTDPLGHTTTFTVDGAGNPLTVTDPRGYVTSRTWDSSGRETSVTDAEGHTVSTAYDADGRPTAVSRTRTVDGSPVVESESYVYDAEGRVTSRTGYDGAVSTLEYDGVGQVTARIDARGNRVELSYDFHGNPVEIRHPDGTRETFEYDAEGRKVATTDRLGRTTRYTRDARGRVVSTELPDGAVESVAYDAAGRKISETDANGQTTTYAYDAAGRLLAVTDPLGGATTFTWDAAGNKLSRTDANGHTTLYEYDAAGRMTAEERPDGSRLTFTYDAAGNRLTETDAAGRTTSYAYDGLGQVVQVTDAAGGVTLYGYDEVGNRTSITDANGNATLIEYDAAGREVARTLPLGQHTRHVYDAAGNRVRTVDANGDVVEVEYDSDDRPVRRTLADGSVEVTTYNATGTVASRTDSRGTTTYTYDSRDRLLRRDDPDGGFLTHTYDAAGNRLSVGSPAGVTRYTYDSAGRMSSVIDADGGVTTYGYDAVGNRTSVDHSNGTRTTYTYDSLNRLTSIETLDAGGAVLASFAYTLGPAGERTRVEEADGRTVDYTYDALYRLTREAVGGSATARTVDYTYDAVGNRLSRSEGGVVTAYSYDANDRLLSAGGTTYTYDDAGRLLSRTDGASATSYRHDSLGRLVEVDGPDGLVELTYDPLGNRVARSVDGVETRYLVDTERRHSQTVEERDGGGALLAAYVHGLDLVSQSRGGVVSVYHSDGVGSVRALTGPAGTVTDRYVYDAFGEEISSTGSTANDHRFAGEAYDANVGFYYLRARHYDPAVGRFASADLFPADLYDPPTLHRYVYALNDPMGKVDPGGEFATAAGLMTSVTFTQMLSTIQPTLIQGTIIYGGVEIFFRPGFELRNLGLHLMERAVDGETWQEALSVYEDGHQIISLGAQVTKLLSDVTGTILDVQGIATGTVGFARAWRNAPLRIRGRVTIEQIRIFEHRAQLVVTEGRILYRSVTRSTSITNIRAHFQLARDYSKAIAEATDVLTSTISFLGG